ncbi:hypothetical protein TNCV_1627751 [Trichonephila clavipes]|nr:hypothetical protein TNCV_1627751 [Trichonephila clavipes]
MPSDRQCQIEDHKIHQGKGRHICLSLAIASSTIQVRLGSTTILRKNTLGMVRGFPLSSSSTNLTRGLAVRWLFRVLPCRKGTIHLQTSSSSPGFESRPYGTAISFTNHYTGWAAGKTYYR